MTVVAVFEVPGEPVPKQRARTVKGRTYTPERTREAEDAVLVAWMKAGVRHTPLKSDRYGVHLTFFRKTKRACDIDNLAKTVLDALNGVAWVDDSQVAILTLAKASARTDRPRTVVRIELVEADA